MLWVAVTLRVREEGCAVPLTSTYVLYDYIHVERRS